jgi:fructose/tagatose bisphosphate aldolase
MARLREQIEIRQAKINITTDLQKQIAEVRLQLQSAEKTNEEKDQLIASLRITIQDQNRHMQEQLNQMKAQNVQMGVLSDEINTMSGTIKSLNQHME